MAGVKDQAERISRCKLSFNFHRRVGEVQGLVNQNIVDKAIFLNLGDDRQGTLFLQEAKLSEGFFDQLKKHPVPVEEAAIRAINNNSMAIDAYAWLAYRLHSLKVPTPIPWPALKVQFGTGFARIDHFRTTFLMAVRLALAVYREAKVEVDERGLLLHPSRPPVSPRIVAFPGKVPTLVRL